jgi:23S rRNA (cytidine1920-2'-O)/16S rRNA (cytidine1409-2'-O)-methyltransferase
MGKRKRLLDLLLERFPETAKKELHARSVCGEVYVNGERIRDPGFPVDPDAEISIRGSVYVSRGGEKLEAALDSWNPPVGGKVFLDAGASTGGFTDCLLKHGAAAVHAVDVGYNQIAFPLRRDSRVLLHERTNLMDLHDLDPEPHAAVADLSFRSIVGAAARLLELTLEGWAIVLIKPQFEYAAAVRDEGGDDPEDFGGVIEDPRRLADILEETVHALEGRGAHVRRLKESPLRGRKGNREYLALIGADLAPPVTGGGSDGGSGEVSGGGSGRASADLPPAVIARLRSE